MTVGRRSNEEAWPGTIALPDGTLVRGRGVRHREPSGATPEFGCYLGVDYDPSWPYGWVEWPNYGLPVDATATADLIDETYERARDGERVEVACLAGVGRTGTVIACLAIRAGLRADHAVTWVRRHYHHRALGNPWQRAWVRRYPRMGPDG